MSVRRWPDILPTPSMPGFGLSSVDPSVRTAMEVGAQRVRRRTFARLDRVTMEWRFTDVEMAAFRTWFESLPYSLLGASDDLSVWNFSANVNRAALADISPDGLAVDRVLETVVNGGHRLTRTDAAFAVNNANLVFTASLKAAGRTLGRMSILDRNGVQCYSNFDLSAGTLGSQSGLLARSVMARGNGWYRVTVVANLGVGVTTPQLTLYLQDDVPAFNYTGDVTKGFGICEVQARFMTGYDLFLPAAADGTALGADGGSAWFLTDIANGGGLTRAEARFTGGYKAVAAAGLNWTVTAEVEVRNA